MAQIKLQADGLNLADTFAFSGTVSGAGGGKVLQCLHYVQESQRNVSSTSWTANDHVYTITPASTSSRIIIHWSVDCWHSSDNGYEVKIAWNHSGISETDLDMYPSIADSDADSRNVMSGWGGAGKAGKVHSYSHVPATTNEITYTMYTSNHTDADTVYFRYYGCDNWATLMEMES